MTDAAMTTGVQTAASQTRALITGGASGIGLAVARSLLARGAAVAVNHLPGDQAAAETVARLAEEAGARGDGRVVAAPGDVSERAQAEAMTADAVEALGGLNLLVNNAGTPGVREPIPLPDLDRLDEAFWHKLLDTNLLGAFWCARAAAGPLGQGRGGAIVNTASIAGLGGGASSLAYAASKAALVNLTVNLARGLAPAVRVNAVAPGLTRTPWTESWPEARKARSVEAALLKRWVEPEDVADAILFLAANPAVTGQTLVVDAGRL